MIIISHQERIISLADEVIVVERRRHLPPGHGVGDPAPDSVRHTGRLPGIEQGGECRMMDTQIDRELLEKIADLIGKPVGAFNIRKDSGCDGRQSTEHIEITGKTDGKSGIDIRVKDGTVGETCHIPVIITKPGIQELVYNDFYIGENCNVNIVAGCGIHNCGAANQPA